jgi:hypothetical protein
MSTEKGKEMLLANPDSHFSPHKPINIMGDFLHKASFPLFQRSFLRKSMAE